MINSFKDEHAWLSNFDETTFYFNGLLIKSVEHGYQAAKAWNDEELETKILEAATPGLAKKLGQTASLPDDWTEMKLVVMATLLMCKFSQNIELAQKLLDTGDQHLEEGNWWGDTYWGVCKGSGLNTLGKLLMQIRSMIAAAPSVEAWCTAMIKETE